MANQPPNAPAGIQQVEAHTQVGLPQLNAETFASQLFWLVVIFVALYVMMSRVAMPKVGGVIAARAGRIKGDIDKAAEAKRKSEETIAAYERALTEARARGLRIGEEAHKAAQADADAKNAAAGERIVADTAKAEVRIAAMRKAAMENVANLARDVTGDIVAKLTGETTPASELSAAVANALKNA